MLTRRGWLASVAGASLAASGVDAFAFEPNYVSVSRHRVGDGAGPLIRIAQLTDLHLKSIGRHEERIASKITGLEPDLILFTGDSIDRAESLPLIEGFLGLLTAATPKVAILGNWEHWSGVSIPRLSQVYERANCLLLRNQSVILRLRGADVLITGLDDLVGGVPNVRLALQHSAFLPNHLLLAHCPAHRDVFRGSVLQPAPMDSTAGQSFDERLLSPQLMLSGHTHGGQIAPFGWAPFRPPGSGRYVRGWYRDEGIPMYVSRGLGTSTIDARFFATPEIAYFEFATTAR